MSTETGACKDSRFFYARTRLHSHAAVDQDDLAGDIRGQVGKRKISILNDIGGKIDLLEQKIKFLTCYISKKIKIDNTSIDNVVIQLEKLNLKKVDDSYSYLLNMPLYTLTKEHLQSLQDDLKNSKEKYKTVNETTIQQMWISDIKYLK